VGPIFFNNIIGPSRQRWNKSEMRVYNQIFLPQVLEIVRTIFRREKENKKNYILLMFMSSRELLNPSYRIPYSNILTTACVMATLP
jgi:hypothetical protein